MPSDRRTEGPCRFTYCGPEAHQSRIQWLLKSASKSKLLVAPVSQLDFYVVDHITNRLKLPDDIVGKRYVEFLFQVPRQFRPHQGNSRPIRRVMYPLGSGRRQHRRNPRADVEKMTQSWRRTKVRWPHFGHVALREVQFRCGAAQRTTAGKLFRRWRRDRHIFIRGMACGESSTETPAPL